MKNKAFIIGSLFVFSILVGIYDKQISEFISFPIYIMASLFVLYIKWQLVSNSKSSKRSLRIFLFDLLISFNLLISITALSLYIPIRSSQIQLALDLAIFLFIGYIDLIIISILNTKSYPRDRLTMYTIIAIIYVLFQFNIINYSEYDIAISTISFLVFADIFVFSLINGISGLKNRIIPSHNNFDYLSLSPKNDIDDSPYFEMIDYAVSHQDIKNVAITSVYGGGKSSIIESYLSKRNHPKEIRISLSNFNLNDELKKNDKKESDTIEDDKLVEKLQLKIIKHLYYRVNRSQLTSSHYIRKEPTYKSFVMYNLTLYLVYILLFTINATFDLFENNVNVLTHFSPLIVSIIIYLILKYSNLKIVNLSTPIGNFSLDSTTTPFDKYLEEIIYFFSKTKIMLVIIEDIDRFQSKSIFTSLREISILLNDCEDIYNKITFLYAINDYLLEEENTQHTKSKFFDLIIPIIPITSRYNSSGYLHELFENNKMSIKIRDKELIEDFIDVKPHDSVINEISFFISDMRTLKTIFNEYIVTIKSFSNNQGLNKDNCSSKLFFDKLFAIIVYKNYMPKDYSDLYNNEGNLFDLLNSRALFIEENSKTIQRKIDLINSKLEFIRFFGIDNQIFLNHIKQLLTTDLNNYSHQLIVYRNPNTGAESQETYSYNTLNSLNIQQLKNCDIEIKYSSRVITPRISFIEWLDKKVNIQNGYQVNIQLRNDLTLELIQSRRELATLNNSSIQTLISSFNDDEIISKIKKIKPQFNLLPIVLALVKNGLISNDYDMYMNYFIEGKRTINDDQYIQAYFSGSFIDPNTVLSDLEGIKDLLLTNFNKDKIILNYSLLDYFLYSDENIFSLLFDSFANSNKDLLIEEYMLTANNDERIERLFSLFILKLSHFADEFLRRASELDEDGYLLDVMLNRILIYSKNIDLHSIFSNESLSFFNNFERVIIYHSEIRDRDYVQAFNNNLVLLKVRFASLVDSPDNNDLIDFIIRNDLYDINYSMVSFLIRKKSNNQIQPTIHNIRKLNLPFFEEYFKKNLIIYIRDILLQLEKPENESIDFINEIINNSVVESDIVEDIIDNKNILFKIRDLSIVNIVHWNNLIKNDKVELTLINLKHIITAKDRTKLSKQNIIKFIYVFLSAGEGPIDDTISKSINICIREYISSQELDYDWLLKLKDRYNFMATDFEQANDQVLFNLFEKGIIGKDILKEIKKENLINFYYDYNKHNGSINTTDFFELVKDESQQDITAFIKNIENPSEKVKLTSNFVNVLDDLSIKEIALTYYQELNEVFEKNAVLHIDNDLFDDKLADILKILSQRNIIKILPLKDKMKISARNRKK